jgi:hypothetical protein
MEKVLKTIVVQVTTREELWTEVFAAAVAAGFTTELAQEQTSKVVNLIFSRIGPEKEAELRLKNQDGRLRPRPISDRPPCSTKAS